MSQPPTGSEPTGSEPTAGQPAGSPQWVYVSTPKKRTGRVVLIVALIVLVVAGLVALISWQMVTAANEARPTASATATATSTPTATPTPTTTPSSTAPATPTPSATASVEPDPEPSATTPPTEPENPQPDEPTGSFDEGVRNRLNDASTGIQVASMVSGRDLIDQVVNPLTLDAQNLADHAVPAASAAQWRATTSAYLAALADLRTAAESGGDTAAAIAAARTQVDALRSLAGM